MFRRGRLWLGLIGVGLCVPLLSTALAGAVSANLSHSYAALGNIPGGSLVSLSQEQSNTVQTANTDDGSRLVGVAVNSSDSLIASDPATTDTQVQVATAGSANVLVSTLNGDIGVGDQIGVSPFDGIGIKAVAGTRVIGVAQTAFNAQASGATTEQVKNKNSQPVSITVGYVNVSIAISTSPSGSPTLDGLQRAAQSLTGHTVSTVRIILSLAILIVALTALITLIYASIYGSVVAVGRNPLAKYAVFRALGSVLSLALAITIITGLAIVLLLS